VVALDLLEREMPELYVLRMKREWGEWLVAGVFNWNDKPGSRVLDLKRLGLDALQPHHVCPHCGAYKGKEVIPTEEEK
jgi:hypothetical protein